MNLRGFRINKEDFLLAASVDAAKVLHVGCTNSPNTERRWNSGTLLHKRLCAEIDNSSLKVVGIDIDDVSVAWLRERLPNDRILVGDAHQLDELFPDERFDVVLAGDVIEHLANPGWFLDACGRVLSDDGVLIITTVNAFGITRLFKAIVGHEAVHDEHTAYFSASTISRLATLSGFSVRRIGYYSMEKDVLRLGVNGFLTFSIDRVFGGVMPWFSEGLVAEMTSEPGFEPRSSGNPPEK